MMLKTTDNAQTNNIEEKQKVVEDNQTQPENKKKPATS